MFSKNQFQQILNELGNSTAYQLQVHDTIDSTSSDLIRALKKQSSINKQTNLSQTHLSRSKAIANAADGTGTDNWTDVGCPLENRIVVAKSQTKGRGRVGRSWHSPAIGNLYISISLAVAGDPSQKLPFIPLAAGLAAVLALKQLSLPVPKLKWPNDLLIGGKKTGGILCEAFDLTQNPVIAVVGFGLNLHQTQFPQELCSIATTLADKLSETKNTSTASTQVASPKRPIETSQNKSLTPEAIAAHWVNQLEQLCHTIDQEGKKQLIHQWKQYCEPFGRRVKVGDVTGKTVDLNQDGQLLIQQDNHQIIPIPGGIVEEIDP